MKVKNFHPNSNLHPLQFFLTYQCFLTKKKLYNVEKDKDKEKTVVLCGLAY